MKGIKLVFLFVAVQALLTGCGPGARVSGSYDLGAQPDKGLVAFAARVGENRCDDLSVLNANVYQVDGSALPSPFAAMNPIMSEDYPEGGYFYVVEYEAGEYQIGKVVAAGLTLTSRSTDEFDLVRFSVTPNEVTYLGELEFSLPRGCSRVHLAVNDRWDRDSTVFEARVPNIAAPSVKKGLMVLTP